MTSPSRWRDHLSQLLDTEQPALRKCDQYYRGRQPLGFLDPAIREASQGRLQALVVNWPRLVVDAVEERLNVEGFRSTLTGAIDASLWDIWQANGMDEQSQQAHLDAFIFGRSFVMVGLGRDPRYPRITVESPLQTTVEIDPGTGEVVAALKRWRQLDGYGRALLITQDTVAQFRSQTAVNSITSWTQGYSATMDTGPGDWVQFQTDPNPLGVVPVVPIINRPRLMAPLGESEIADVMPIADAVNKLSTDMMVSAEFHAQPRRWATGVPNVAGGGPASAVTKGRAEEAASDVRRYWEEARKSKVWLANNPDAKFGQFPEAQLDNFIGAIRLLTMQVAAIAGLPPHYLGLVSDNAASADAIRSAEASLVMKAYRRQRTWGEAWEDVMRLAIHVRDGVAPTALDGMETVWRSPETRTVAQAADAASKLYAAGIVDRQTALEELNYTPAVIDRITNAGGMLA